MDKCNTKVSKASAVLHMSYHQLEGDSEKCICGFCGKSGHAPKLNATGKKLVFPAECGFAGNNLNVKSLKTISSASPFSNYPRSAGRVMISFGVSTSKNITKTSMKVKIVLLLGFCHKRRRTF